MKKPLHWVDIEHENRAILSALAMIKLDYVIKLIENGLEREEVDSALWGYWEENKKELRPHIYKQWKIGKEII